MKSRDWGFALLGFLVGLAPVMMILGAVGTGTSGSGAVPASQEMTGTLDVLRARRLEIVDQRGRVVFAVGMVEGQDVATVGLRVPDAKDGIMLLSTKEGSSIDVLSEGKPAVTIARSERGGGLVHVYNPLGKKVVDIQAGKTNCGIVAVADFDGNVKMGLYGSP